jgi:hypothetical protein
MPIFRYRHLKLSGIERGGYNYRTQLKPGFFAAGCIRAFSLLIHPAYF